MRGIMAVMAAVAWLMVGGITAWAITAGQGEAVPASEAWRNGKTIVIEAYGWVGDNYLIVVSAKESYYIEDTRVYLLERPEATKDNETVSTVTARSRKKIDAPATIVHDGQKTVIEFADAANKATWKLALTSAREGRAYLVPLQLD